MSCRPRPTTDFSVNVLISTLFSSVCFALLTVSFTLAAAEVCEVADFFLQNNRCQFAECAQC